VATIWKSTGTVGPDSTDAGTQMPLDVIDERLKDFRLFYHGKRPRTMLPRGRGYHYQHIVIEVTTLDEPLPVRFPLVGFYQVVGLRVLNAGFLFESP